MEEISIDKFKMGFNNIADLVVSLDKENKAILKPRIEIINYLDCNTPEIQLIIIEELLEAFNLGAISESYLENKGEDFYPKISFENYCKHFKSGIKSKMKFERFLVDDSNIKRIKNRIEGFNNKNDKINYLLDQKKILEGDYPEVFGKTLTKNPIYLFLKRELEYWEKYVEIPSDTRNLEPQILPRLQTNLTSDQRTKFFTELVNGGFIPNECKDCFNWALSAADEKEPKQPGQWQPIKWNKSKTAFWELFQPILKMISGNEKTISREHKRIIRILFLDGGGDPMDKLTNPKPNEKSKQKSEIEDILRVIGIITEQLFKHHSIR